MVIQPRQPVFIKLYSRTCFLYVSCLMIGEEITTPAPLKELKTKEPNVIC